MIVKKIEEAIEQKLADFGFDLIGVEYIVGKGGKSRNVLKVFIDKAGGVTIDDCAKASYLIDKDIAEVFNEDTAYFLEVSSPGIDRKLKKMKDFQKAVGKLCKIVLHEKVDDEIVFKGTIIEAEDNMVTIEIDGERKKIPFSNIKKAKLDLNL